jgi:Family of unknown function (DUF6519)
VFPIVRLATGDNTTTVTLGNLGRDERFGLREGDFVEVQDDLSVLANIPGILLQVRSIDRTGLVVVLSGTTTPGVGAVSSRHPLLRRWDHQAGDPAAGGLTLGQDNAALILGGGVFRPAEVQVVAAGADRPAEAGIPAAAPVAAALGHDIWLNLEDGVQIAFTEPVPATYRTGDYWLIPARVATGDVIWPQETWTDAQGNVVVAPVARRPDGVEHHYAPLAVVTVDGKKVPVVQLCHEGAASGMIKGG